MSSQHAYELGCYAYHEGGSNPFPSGIAYRGDWEYGYYIENAYEEWLIEDQLTEDRDYVEWCELEADHLDDEPEPFEIDANDFDIPD